MVERNLDEFLVAIRRKKKKKRKRKSVISVGKEVEGVWTRAFNNSVGVSGVVGRQKVEAIGNKLVSMPLPFAELFKRSRGSTTSTPETITTLIEILFVPFRVVFQTIAPIFLRPSRLPSPSFLYLYLLFSGIYFPRRRFNLGTLRGSMLIFFACKYTRQVAYNKYGIS